LRGVVLCGITDVTNVSYATKQGQPRADTL
jgi:hypothetical protein